MAISEQAKVAMYAGMIGPKYIKNVFPLNTLANHI
jgi:hypothetical protein